MAPSFCIDLRPGEPEQLLGIARQSIHSGLHTGSALEVAPHELSESLTARMGVFVTLMLDSRLRGCIGSMQSSEPLAQSVADSAYGAAFQDPRFPRLRVEELEQLDIEISILSPMEAVEVESRTELLDSLRPGLDGLLLEDGVHRSTFLPKVWEQLPSPALFLEHLLAKAGLPNDHWSATLRLHRYHTVSVSESQLSPPIQHEG